MRRAADFRWPQHRKHPSLERLRRPGVFLSATLTREHLLHALELARKEALADLAAVGITIANNGPPAADIDDSSESDGDDSDQHLATLHINAHDGHADSDSSDGDSSDGDHSDGDSDEAAACGMVDLLHEDDTSDEEVASGAFTLAASDRQSLFLVRPHQPEHERTSPYLPDLSGAKQHKQRACAYVTRHAKLSNDRILRYRQHPRALPSTL